MTSHDYFQLRVVLVRAAREAAQEAVKESVLPLVGPLSAVLETMRADLDALKEQVEHLDETRGEDYQELTRINNQHNRDSQRVVELAENLDELTGCVDLLQNKLNRAVQSITQAPKTQTQDNNPEPADERRNSLLPIARRTRSSRNRM